MPESLMSHYRLAPGQSLDFKASSGKKVVINGWFHSDNGAMLITVNTISHIEYDSANANEVTHTIIISLASNDVKITNTGASTLFLGNPHVE